MRFLADENIPLKLIDLLRGLGHDVETVRDVPGPGSGDERVFRHARETDRIIVTRDKDLSEIAHRTVGEHPGVVLIRVYPETRDNMVSAMERLLRSSVAFSQRLVTVENTRVRIFRR